MRSRQLEPSTFDSKPQLRILLIGKTLESTGGLFSAANHEVIQITSDAAVKLLRRQTFDVAVAIHPSESYLAALQAAAPQTLAIIVASSEPSETALPRYCQTLADDYLNLTGATPEYAIWILSRAIQRRQLLIDAQQFRASQSKEENCHAAIHQVRALRAAMLEDSDCSLAHPPAWLVSKLNELLKAYVVSVSEDLNGEIESFVDGLLQSGVTVHETLMAHSFATEEILLGLGNRPGWHTLGRSQILAHRLTMLFLESLKPNGDPAGIGLVADQVI